MTRPWLRLYRSAINNPKVGRLGLEERGFWVSLLMLSDDEGNLPDEGDLAWACRVGESDAIRLLDVMSRNGLVTRYVTEGVTKLRLHDWDEHQRSSDHDVSGAERQRRFRERQKAQKSAVPVVSEDRNALRNGPVTPPDTDTDTDKTLTSFVADKPKAKRGTSLPDGFVLPDEWIEAAIAARERQGKRDIPYQAEAERFVNHFVANGKAMKDWRRAWLNWATSPYVDQLSGGRNARGSKQGFTDTMRDIAGEIRAAEAKAVGGGGLPAPGAGRGGVGDGED